MLSIRTGDRERLAVKEREKKVNAQTFTRRIVEKRVSLIPSKRRKTEKRERINLFSPSSLAPRPLLTALNVGRSGNIWPWFVFLAGERMSPDEVRRGTAKDGMLFLLFVLKVSSLEIKIVLKIKP